MAAMPNKIPVILENIHVHVAVIPRRRSDISRSLPLCLSFSLSRVCVLGSPNCLTDLARMALFSSEIKFFYGFLYIFQFGCYVSQVVYVFFEDF